MGTITKKTYQLKNGAFITIRSATIEDAEQMRACVIAYINDNKGQVWKPEEVSPTVEQERNWIKKMLENPLEILLVADCKDQIIGSLDFHIGNRIRLKHAGEFGMSVMPLWRGLGLGTLFLETLITWAKNTQKIEKINLRVLSNNSAALQLYKKFGFIDEGRKVKEVKYSDDEYADEIYMGFFL